MKTQISLISRFRIDISIWIMLMTNEKLTKGFALAYIANNSEVASIEWK